MRRKRRATGAKTDDRISSLPDDVLIIILSKLHSTLSAVRTGILARRWRNLWKHTPNLHFSFADFRGPRQESSRLVATEFVRFVKRSLTLHAAPGTKELNIELNCWPLYPSCVNPWLRSAMRKGVQHIRYSGYSGNRTYRVPARLFCSTTLTTLDLVCCRIKIDRLDCSTLTHLSFESCSVHIQLFDCPSLTHLHLLSNCSILVEEFSPLNSLCQLHLRFVLFKGGTLSKLCTACAHVQKLSLQHFLDQVTQLPFLNSLHVLSLWRVNFEKDAFTRFLAGCPLLVDLDLECVHNDCLIPSSNLHLKRLTVKNIDDWIKVVVNAPNLRILKVSLVDSLKLSLVEMLSLKMVDLTFDNVDHSPIRHVHFMNLIKNVRHAEVLKLCQNCVKVMSLPATRELHLLKTKCLELRTGLDEYHLLGLANLLWCSPHLDTLILKLVSSGSNGSVGISGFDETKFWKSFTFLCLKCNLKTIEISSTMETEVFVNYKDATVSLVRFLLQHAMVLKKMTIHILFPHSMITEKQEVNMSEVAQELLALPRASSTAEVLFLDK